MYFGSSGWIYFIAHGTSHLVFLGEFLFSLRLVFAGVDAPFPAF